MFEAEHAGADDRDAAEARCREAILSFWRHRRTLETRRPLISADAKLDAIKVLPDKKLWCDNDLWSHKRYELDRAINAARHVDTGARAVIRCLIAMSFGQNVQPDLDWLELAPSPTFADTADSSLASTASVQSDLHLALVDGKGCIDRRGSWRGSGARVRVPCSREPDECMGCCNDARAVGTAPI